MRRRLDSLPVAFTVAFIATALAAISVSMLLTDSRFTTSLAPGDIVNTLTEGMGGQVEATISGDTRRTLPLPAVLMRLMLVAAAAVGLSVARTNEDSPRRQRMAKTLYRLSRVWGLFGCFSLLVFVVDTLGWSAGILWLSASAAIIAGMGFGGTLWIFCESVFDQFGLREDSPAASRWILLPLGAAALWSVGSIWMNWRLYDGLWIPHGDSAMYEEHLWNVRHGKGFRSYLDQGLFLGEHIQVIHLLLLPLHLIWPSHMLLETAETAALAACVVPLYRITRRHTASPAAAAALATAWLAYYPMHFLDIAIDFKTFRPMVLGLPFLLWCIDSLESQRFRTAWLTALLALSAKEDFALVLAPLGLVFCLFPPQGLSVDKPHTTVRRHGFGLFLFSTCYLGAVVLLVIPWFRDGAVVHYSRYFGDLGNSPGELIRTAIAEPHRVLAKLIAARTWIYAGVFLLPLALRPLRAPLALAAGIPLFAMLSLLELGADDSSGLPPVPYHHFHATLLPVLFWAAACGLQKAAASAQSAAGSIGRLILLCSLGTACFGSLTPLGVNFWSEQSPYRYEARYAENQRLAMLNKALTDIPEEAVVAATDYAHTRMTHFRRSYDYSGYLRAVNQYQPGVPPDTEYIVIDTHHPYSTVRSAADVRELQQQPGEWELLDDRSNEMFLVIKRRVR